MRVILYYLALLVLIGLLTGFLLSGQPGMAMPQMLGASAFLVLYTVAISLVGEGKTLDEREILHRNLANRAGLVAGTIIFSVGIIYQMFVVHKLDWWLPAGLIVINLTKIVSLIYLENNK